jgi:hypothetical protein
MRLIVAPLDAYDNFTCEFPVVAFIALVNITVGGLPGKLAQRMNSFRCLNRENKDLYFSIIGGG